MTPPLLLSEDQKKELIYRTKRWLGYDGIVHLQDIKELHGTLDATWMELGVADNIIQYIPRNVFNQEGQQFKNFLKSIEVSKDWSDEDFNSSWVWLLEKSIKD